MSQLDLQNSNLVKAVAALTNNHDYVTSISKKPSFIRKIEKKNQRQVRSEFTYPRTLK